MLAVVAVLAGLAVFGASAGGFGVGETVNGEGEQEGGGGQEEESFHIFRFNTIKI
jgi:hypothetical protein